MPVCLNAITSTSGSGNLSPRNDGWGLPSGTNAQRLLGVPYSIRGNTTSSTIEATIDGVSYITIGSAVGPILSITGTPNRITVSPGVNPVIDIAATYVGQTSITTLGVVTTGTWAGTAVAEIHGGTNQTTYTLGDTLYASAANTLSKLAGNTTNVKQYLSQTGTGAVSAAPAWATISGGDITGAALTEVNDTNVTLTLGGNPATALLRAASITAGWTGQLSLARGGTNGNLTASAGGIVWSDASQMQILAGTATASKMLLSGSSASPSWSTSTIPSSAGAVAGKVLVSDGTNYVLSSATFPTTVGAVGTILRSDGTNWIATTATFANTYSASNLLYSNGANTVTGLSTANSAVLVTSSAGVPAWSGTMTNGQVIIGSTGATPTAATLTALANSGIDITNAAASITIGTNGVLKSFQIFTSGTAATYTKPAGINNILVECVGGGGGGGGAASTITSAASAAGGGAGGYCRKLITSAASTYTYTVGAAANGGSAGNNAGTAGNNTTFSTLTANGGGAGGGGVSTATVGAFSSVGTGGTASGGDINLTGGAGTIGLSLGTNSALSGAGGNSHFAGGAPQVATSASSTAGNDAAANSGSGGSGGASSGTSAAAAGGNGAAGLIIVWEFA